MGPSAFPSTLSKQPSRLVDQAAVRPPGEAPDNAPDSTPDLQATVATTRQLAQALTRLSTVISQAHALRQRHSDDQTLGRDLIEIASRLESIIDCLFVDVAAADDGPGERVQRSGLAEVPRQYEQALLSWLYSTTRPESIDLQGQSHPTVPLAQLLGRVTTSRRQLPSHISATLSWPSEATFGDLATELLVAVLDPAGPRCPTFADAVKHLQTR